MTDIEDKRLARYARYGIMPPQEKLPAADELRHDIDAGRSVLLHGTEGLGSMHPLSQLKEDVVAVTPFRGVEPEKLFGKKDEKGDFVPPSWCKDLCEKCAKEPDKNHVLLINEIEGASEHNQAEIYSMVYLRALEHGAYKLPKNVAIILQSNNEENTAKAYNMPDPVWRHLCHLSAKPTIEEWLEWGAKTEKGAKHPNIHPVIRDFVKASGKLYTPYDPEEPTDCVDPRKWEKLSGMIYVYGNEVRKEFVEMCLGPEMAKEFIDFADHNDEPQKSGLKDRLEKASKAGKKTKGPKGPKGPNGPGGNGM